MAFYTHICPKCGYTRKSNIEDKMTDLGGTHCFYCGTPYVKTDVEFSEFYDLYCESAFEGKPIGLERLNQQMYRRYVFNSLEFDENQFNKRQERDDREQAEDDMNYNEKKQRENSENIPKCPICQSANITSIGGLERGVSVLTLGLFSKKINKSFKCNHCGMTF